MSREVFQALYFILNLFLSLKILSNIGLGLAIPIYMWIIHGITSFLVIGKIIYCLFEE